MTFTSIKSNAKLVSKALFCTAIVLPIIGHAQSSYTINNTIADAFLATGSPSNPVGVNLTTLNFGGAGTLAISPASSTKGEMDSIIQFSLASAFSQFNVTYGTGNWQVTGLTLSLASNFGGQGEQPNNGIFNTINAGNFGIDWLGNNTWVEGNGSGMGTPGYPNNSFVTYDSISSLFGNGSSALGTFTYTPPGDNVYVNYALPLDLNLVSDVENGRNTSLYFFAADNQVSYLFNARSFAQNHPELTITVSPTPEPSALALSAIGLVGAAAVRRWKRQK
jgi:hypothetical protein